MPPTKIVFHVVKRTSNGALKDFVETVKICDSPEAYKIPEELQPLEVHTELSNIQAIKKAVKSITKAGQYRNVKTTLTDELLKTYWDQDENFIFKDCILEEIHPDVPIGGPNDPVLPHVELSSFEGSPGEKNILSILSKIEKNFALPKFDKVCRKASDWIDDFEKECTRFGITTDEMKVRALRYFVQDASDEWYRACLTQFSIGDFGSWKRSFLSVFGERGWSRMEYAFGLKYLAGSYSDYAIKKLRLLLDVEREMTVESRMNLIVFGLPSEVRRRIDKKDISGIDSLMNELSLFEPPMKTQQQQPQRKNRDDGVARKTDASNTSMNASKWRQEMKPCTICENLNLRSRFHPAEKCWNRGKKKIPGAHVNLNKDSFDEDTQDHLNSKN